MKFRGLMAAAVAVGIMAAPGMSGHIGNPSPLDGNPFEPRRRRGKGQSTRRGKGVQAKPKKRSNRLTISKRVRRKHRRA